MASIFNALNVGSGIDVRALVSGLVAADRAPRQALLDERQARAQSRVSAQGQFRAAIDALVGALASRVSSGSLSGIASVSDPSILTMRVNPGAIVARQTLEVRQLAQGQTLASATIADAAAPIGQGSITIRFGTVAGTAEPGGFSAGSVADLVVTIGPEEDSLAGMRNAINDAAARTGAPVQAQLVTDADGSRLLLRGSMGAASGFLVETTGDPGLDAFAFPESGAAGLGRTQAALDAEVAIDGVVLRRPSNAIDDLVPGARLALGRAAPGTMVVVEAQRSGAELSQVVSDLASALNELSAIGRELTRAGSATGSAGALVSDSATRRAVQSLTRLTTEPLLVPDGNAPVRLSDIGVSLTRDGDFVLDSARLARAVRDFPESIERMVTALNRPAGFGVEPGRLPAIASAFRTATAGNVGQRPALQRELEDIARQRTILDERMNRLSETYTRQFAALDRSVGQSRALQSFLTQQIDIWTRSRDR